MSAIPERNKRFCFLAVGWLLLIVVSLPMFFVVKVNYSDLLFLENVAVDFYEHHGRWSGWAMTPSPAYLPDLAIYLLSYPFTGYAMDRIFFLSLCQAILIVLSGWYCIRPLLIGLCANFQFATLAIMAMMSYCSVHQPMWLYYNCGNNHIGSVIFTFLALGMVLRIYVNASIRSYSKFFLLCLVAHINGQLFSLWFLFPLIIIALCFTAVTLCIRRNPAFLRCNLILLGIIAAVFATAFFIRPYITVWDGLERMIAFQDHRKPAADVSKLALTVPLFFNSLIAIVATPFLPYRLLAGGWLLGFFAILLHCAKCLISVHYQLYTSGRDITADDRFWSMKPVAVMGDTQRFYLLVLMLFTLVLLPLNFVATMITGQFEDIHFLRYFMVSIMLPIMLGLVLVARYSRVFNHRFFSGAMAAGAVVYTAYFLFHFNEEKPNRTVAQIRNYSGSFERFVADCVDEHVETFGLKAGIGHFQVSRPVTLMSRKGIVVNQVFWGSLSVQFYMNNLDWFLGQRNHAYQNIFYNFVITGGEPQMKQVFTNLAGTPSRSFMCGKDVTVYVYDDNRLDNAFYNANEPTLYHFYQQLKVSY